MVVLRITSRRGPRIYRSLTIRKNVIAGALILERLQFFLPQKKNNDLEKYKYREGGNQRIEISEQDQIKQFFNMFSGH